MDISQLEYLIRWNKLKSIQNNKIIKSTYIWLVIVPITAKTLSRLEDTFTFSINSHEYILDLALPFSWQIFFLSALFFVLGNIFYIFSSPRIINEFSDYGHFSSTGGSHEDIEEFKTRALEEKEAELKSLEEILKASNRESTAEERKKDRFWKIYKFYNESCIKSRAFISLLYLIGLLLFSWVAIKNIIWVFTQITIF